MACPLVSDFSVISGAINITFAQSLMGGRAFLEYKFIHRKKN